MNIRLFKPSFDKKELKSIEEAFDIGTSNITSGAINDVEHISVLAPYKFNLQDDKLNGELAIVNLTSKNSKLLSVDLSLEPNG